MHIGKGIQKNVLPNQDTGTVLFTDPAVCQAVIVVAISGLFDAERNEIKRIYQYEGLRREKQLRKDRYFYVDLKALTGQDIKQSIYIKPRDPEGQSTFFGLEANLMCKIESGVL